MTDGLLRGGEGIARVAAVVVTYNRLDLLRECIDALRCQTHPLAALIVVNNGSTDGTAEWLDLQDDLLVIHQGPEGPARGLHAGVTRALEEDCDFIWTFDDDAIARPAALERLLASPACTPGNIVGSLVVSVEDPALLAFPMPRLSSYNRLLDFYPDQVNTVAEVEAESDERGYAWGMFTNATLLPRQVVDRVGLTERDFYMGGEETEYFYRVRSMGYATYLVLDSLVDHPRKVAAAMARSKEMSLARNTVYIHRLYRRWFVLRTAKRFVQTILQRRFYLLAPLWHGLRGDFSKRYDVQPEAFDVKGTAVGAPATSKPRIPWRRDPVARTLLGLYAIQGATVLLPLITLPYLARVLDAPTLGLLFFSQGFAALITAVLAYGFDLSATRDVAQRLGDRRGLAEVAAGVFGAKLVLFLVTALAAVAMGLGSSLLRENPRYLLFAWIYGVALGFSPLWFFLGAERMRTMTITDLAARLVAAAGILVFVHDPGDGWKVLALQAIATSFAMAYALVHVYRTVPFIAPRPGPSLRTLREGGALAIFRAATIFRIHGPAIVVGVLTSARQVGYYGVADRLNRVPASILWPIYQAVYARLNHLLERDPAGAERLRRSSTFVLFGLALLIAIAVALFAPIAVNLIFGEAYGPAIDLLRVLAFVVPFHAFVNAMGVHFLLPLRRDFALALPVAIGAVFALLVGIALVPPFGAIAMAAAAVAGEIMTVVVMYVVAVRRGFTLRDATAGIDLSQGGSRTPTSLDGESASIGPVRTRVGEKS